MKFNDSPLNQTNFPLGKRGTEGDLCTRTKSKSPLTTLCKGGNHFVAQFALVEYLV